ncbi:hypothetical protein M5689_022591 [Euphorbia peplus]|nr:hypothetical protein M5689_022591 [Euphorbia peplus]
MDQFPFIWHQINSLPTRKQDEEIGKLFIILGGIRITRFPNESDNRFRKRTFRILLKKLPSDSKYIEDFFRNLTVPSLITDFKDLDDQEESDDEEETDEAESEGTEGEERNQIGYRNSEMDTSSILIANRGNEVFEPQPQSNQIRNPNSKMEEPDGTDYDDDRVEIVEQTQNQNPNSEMDNSSTLIDVFSRMITEHEEEELKNLSIVIANRGKEVYDNPVRSLGLFEPQLQNTQIQNPKSKMDSLSSILLYQFKLMRAEEQEEEIRKLSILLAGIIPIWKDPRESDEYFRIRNFKMAMENIPKDSEYKKEFYDKSIIKGNIGLGRSGFSNPMSVSSPVRPEFHRVIPRSPPFLGLSPSPSLPPPKRRQKQGN